ncbi:unnamed protein product [Cuscuta campestris]|uniref:Uncharacterized protein n=2 Tax=Cuscuta sect. Cleistogrammica TaxID=1824901 RepID=A0A484KEG9_9ASTE|nr:hypothetical protein DM860_015806 [Cuscuta australis]VFQ63770.1 unnamed protein product [Cuscuta campestris]
MDGFLETPFDDDKDLSVSNDEATMRRLKNRERQRRYRARKRLEADTGKAPGNDLSQSTRTDAKEVWESPKNNRYSHILPEVSVTGIRENGLPVARESPMLVSATCQNEMAVAQECLRHENPIVTRVYCGRDWKQDARKAHGLRREQEVITDDATRMRRHSGNDEPDIARSDRIALDVSEQAKNETPRVMPSRRHWKADARNKKG